MQDCVKKMLVILQLNYYRFAFLCNVFAFEMELQWRVMVLMLWECLQHGLVSEACVLHDKLAWPLQRMTLPAHQLFVFRKFDCV